MRSHTMGHSTAPVNVHSKVCTWDENGIQSKSEKGVFKKN